MVVGSGAGGATIAAALAEAGKRVIVLEEGPRVTPADLEGDPARAVRRFYRNSGAVISFGDPALTVQVGRAVGGSTVINGGTCFRTPAAVLEDWSARMGGAFTAAELEPLFAETERDLSVVQVQPEEAFVGERRFLEAARASGAHGDYVQRNALRCQGTHLCPFVCPTGAKQSVERTYLARAERSGAEILAETRVSHVRMSGRRAIGVTAHDEQNREIEIDAARIAVCAGALHTPTLLRKSLGALTPKAVGRTLLLHPGAHVAGIFAEEIGPRRGPIQAVYVSGPDDRYVIYGMGYPPEVYGTLTMRGGADLSQLERYQRSIMVAVMVADHDSRGHIAEIPGVGPLPRYDLSSTDAESVCLGIAHAAEILLAMGAREVHASVRGLPVLRSPADLAPLRSGRIGRGQLLLGSVHPMATAPMGLDPKRSALDADLRVHGIDNLYAPDASFFPSSLGVNPQITIMAFAKRAASHMLSSL